MARRRPAEKRIVQPDPRYGSVVFGKFINTLMWEGKKSVAEKIFYQAVEELGPNGPELVNKAFNYVKPSVEVRPRRVGGATYQVPCPVSPVRSMTLAFRWIIDAARKRSEKTMWQRLAAELQNAANEKGAAIKKREDSQKMAMANMVFSQYRW